MSIQQVSVLGVLAALVVVAARPGADGSANNTGISSPSRMPPVVEDGAHLASVDDARSVAAVDTHAAAQSDIYRFVAAVFQTADAGELVELRMMKRLPGETDRRGRTKKKVVQEYFAVRDLHLLSAAARTASANGYDVYIGFNPRCRRGGTKSDVARTVTLVADLDVGDGKMFATLADALTAIAQMAALGLPPSIVVASGGGVHLYWLLAQALPVAEADAATAINTRLAQFLRGDNVGNLAGILRVPATLNFKLAHSRPVTLSECHAERRYTLADFDDRLPHLSTAARSKSSSRSSHGAVASAGAMELSPHLRRVLEATNWPLQVKRQRSGEIVAVVLDECPACTADPVARPGAEHGTAHISPILGALRCKRGKCPACSANGIDLEDWVTLYASHVLAVFARPALTAPAAEEVCSIEDTEVRVTATVREAIDWSDAVQGRVAVVSVTAGIGKTRLSLRELAAANGRGTFLASSHSALDEREQEAGVLGLYKRRRHYGLLTVVDSTGRPVCRYANALAPWAALGVPLRGTACLGCPDQDNYAGTGMACAAYAGATGIGTRFATHAHAPHLGVTGALSGPIIVDELPSLLSAVKLSMGELRAIAKTWNPGVFQPRVDHWTARRALFVRVLLVAIDDLLGSGKIICKRYAVRVSGIDLQAALQSAAAASATTGALGRLVPPLAPGEDPLLALRRSLDLAHDEHPTPPVPLACDIRDGRADAAGTPPAYLDDVLLGLATEGTGGSRPGSAACVVLDSRVPGGARVEFRSLAFSGWVDGSARPLSLVVLDATGSVMESSIRAAMPGREVRIFRLDVPEPAHVRRLHYLTSSLTRRQLLGTRTRLKGRGVDAIVRLLRTFGAQLGLPMKPANIGVITHRPVAQILDKCVAALDSQGDSATASVESAGAVALLNELARLRSTGVIAKIDILWFGGQRGSNVMADVDALLLLGDPWPDLGAAHEEARALGISPDVHTGALLDAEVTQALGRARAVRRGPQQPLLIVYAGKEGPAGWSQATAPMVAPRGGPTPTESGVAVEILARDLAARWGAACPALIRLCAKESRLPGCLDAWATSRTPTAIRRVSYSGWRPTHPALPAQRFFDAALLPTPTLRDACRRALGALTEAKVTAPAGGASWRMRQDQPGAAAALVIAIRQHFSQTCGCAVPASDFAGPEGAWLLAEVGEPNMERLPFRSFPPDHFVVPTRILGGESAGATIYVRDPAPSLWTALNRPPPDPRRPTPFGTGLRVLAKVDVTDDGDDHYFLDVVMFRRWRPERDAKVLAA